MHFPHSEKVHKRKRRFRRTLH